jgi:hypothetical protein
MTTQILRMDDVHAEMAGPTALGPVPHPFEASPNATQAVLFAQGHPLLREGDPFTHTGSSHHKPQAGSSFANPAGVTASGRVTAAGQRVLFCDGQPVQTPAGRLETCSDAAREASADAAVTLTAVPVMYLDGAPALPGNN